MYLVIVTRQLGKALQIDQLELVQVVEHRVESVNLSGSTFARKTDDLEARFLVASALMTTTHTIT